MIVRHSYFLLLISIPLFQCSSPLKKYELTAIRWEKDIQEFERLDTIEKYPENAILFTGSSSIRLWKTIEKDMAPYPVIQRGFGGSTMSDVAYYIKRIVYPHQFKAVVLFVGNDITGSLIDKTPEEVLNLFMYIHRTIHSRFPDKPIYFIEITPTNSRWKAWPEIKKVNAQIQQFCQSKSNTYFIETANLYLGSDGKPNASLFAEDQLHQNWEGYKLWTKAIKDKLGTTLK